MCIICEHKPKKAEPLSGVFQNICKKPAARRFSNQMPGYVRVYQLFSGRGSQAHKSKWYYDIKKTGGYKWCPEMPHKFKNELETMCFFHVFFMFFPKIANACLLFSFSIVLFWSESGGHLSVFPYVEDLLLCDRATLQVYNAKMCPINFNSSKHHTYAPFFRNLFG